MLHWINHKLFNRNHQDHRQKGVLWEKADRLFCRRKNPNIFWQLKNFLMKQNTKKALDSEIWWILGSCDSFKRWDFRITTRLRRWYLTIPSSDQWWTTIENHHYQWLPDPKTIGKPSFPMIACNHSIQWWWYPWKPLELCNGSKYWLKTRTELLQMSGKVPI